MQSRSLQLAVRGKPSAFDFDADNDLCVVASPGCMTFFHLDGLGSPRHVIHYEQPQQVRQIKFQNSGPHIAALRGGIISLWDPSKSMRPLIGFIQSTGWITDIGWHTSNTNLIASSSDASGGIAVWDVRSPSYPALSMAAGQISGSVDWSPVNPNLLAASSEGQRVLVWDVRMISGSLISAQSQGAGRGRIESYCVIEPDRDQVIKSCWVQDVDNSGRPGIVIGTGTGALQWWSLTPSLTAAGPTSPIDVKRDGVSSEGQIDSSSILYGSPTGRGVIVCKRNVIISSAAKAPSYEGLLSSSLDAHSSIGRSRDAKNRSLSEDQTEPSRPTVSYRVSVTMHGPPRPANSLRTMFTPPEAGDDGDYSGSRVELATCYESLLGALWGKPGKILPPAHSGLELLLMSETALLHAVRIPQETIKYCSADSEVTSVKSSTSASATAPKAGAGAGAGTGAAGLGILLGGAAINPTAVPKPGVAATAAPKYALRRTLAGATRATNAEKERNSLFKNGGTDADARNDFVSVLNNEVLALQEVMKLGTLEGLNFGRLDLYARQITLEMTRMVSSIGDDRSGTAKTVPASPSIETTVTLILSFPPKFPSVGVPTFTLRGAELGSSTTSLIAELNNVARHSCSRLTAAHSSSSLQGLAASLTSGSSTHLFSPLQRAMSQMGPGRSPVNASYLASSPDFGGGKIKSSYPHSHSGFLVDIARSFRSRVQTIWSRNDDEEGKLGSNETGLTLPNEVLGEVVEYDEDGQPITKIVSVATEGGEGIERTGESDGHTESALDATQSAPAVDVIDPLAYRVPCPRSSGACFSALGVLVCYGGAILSLNPVEEDVDAGERSPRVDVTSTTLKGSSRVAPSALPYPKTYADLQVAERMRMEQLAIEAAEEAAAAEKAARDAAEMAMSKSNHGSLRDELGYSTHGRRRAFTEGTETTNQEYSASGSDTSSVSQEFDSESDDGSLAVDGAASAADLEKDFLSGAGLPDDFNPKTYLVAPAPIAQISAPGQGTSLTQGQPVVIVAKAAGHVASGTTNAVLNELGASTTSLASYASSSANSVPGGAPPAQRAFVGGGHHRTTSTSSTGDNLSALQPNRATSGAGQYSTPTTLPLSATLSSQAQTLIQGASMLPLDLMAAGAASSSSGKYHRRNMSNTSTTLVSQPSSTGSLTDSAPASTARPESPRETGESLISAYGASILPLSIAHPGETLEMLGATLDHRQELQMGDGLLSYRMGELTFGTRNNNAGGGVQWPEVLPIRAMISSSARPSWVNFYQVADSRAQLLAFQYSLGPLPRCSSAELDADELIERWHTRATACRRNAAVTAEVEAVIQSRRQRASIGKCFDREVGCCPGGAGSGSMRSVQQIWNLLAASLDVMTLSGSVCSNGSASSGVGQSKESPGGDNYTTLDNTASERESKEFRVFENDSGSGMDWKTSALGRSLLIRCINALRENGDLQTLATLICIVGGSAQLHALLEPSDDSSSSAGTMKLLTGVKLRRPFPLQEIERVLSTYAEVTKHLDSAQSLEGRHSMKHTQSPQQAQITGEDEYYLGDDENKSQTSNDFADYQIASTSSTVIMGVNCPWCGNVTGSDRCCIVDEKDKDNNSNSSAGAKTTEPVPSSSSNLRSSNFSSALQRGDDGSTEVVGDASDKGHASRSGQDKDKSAIIRCNPCNSYALSCSICQMAVRGSGYFCIKCGHGGHAEHLREWFQRRADCAVGCGCRCGDLALQGASRNVGRQGQQPAAERLWGWGGVRDAEGSDDEEGGRRELGDDARGVIEVTNTGDGALDDYTDSDDDDHAVQDSDDDDDDSDTADKYAEDYETEEEGSEGGGERMHRSQYSPYRDEIDTFESFQYDLDEDG